MVIREIDPHSVAEVQLVAERMRLTLMEVMGEERGSDYYPVDWLIQRVRFHLDGQCVGQVFLAEGDGGEIVGHTIVRIEPDDNGQDIGLFSTTYVEEGARRRGVAQALLKRGEEWMRAQGMCTAVTYTTPGNEGLKKLFLNSGYSSEPVNDDFIRIQKTL